MENNTNLVIEVCNLNELGYPLARTQAELTTIQKGFLFKAYPIFNEMQKDSENGGDAVQKQEWKRKQKIEIERRRAEQKQKQRIDGK